MPIFKSPRPNHDPKDFHLSLRREGDDCCHDFRLKLPGAVFELSPCHARPQLDLINAAILMFLGGCTTFERPIGHTWEWDGEPQYLRWKSRPIRKHPKNFRLYVYQKPCFHTDDNIVEVDTVLDTWEFGRQVLRETTRLLREHGIAAYDRHSGHEFPLDRYLRLHTFVTGNPRPSTFAEQVRFLTETL